jgi:hypothetical protein
MLTPRLLLIPLLLLAAAIPACNIAVPIAYAIQGPPKVDAVFEPDSKRTTVILIDDPSSKIPRRELRLTAGQVADETLMKAKVFDSGKLVSSKSALNAARGSDQGPKLSVVDIGRRVGAEVIVYAEVTDWTLFSDGQGISPKAAVSVRVFDTLSNTRVFPEEGGYPLIASLPPEAESKQSNKGVLERALAKELGLTIARALYTHDRPQLQNSRPTLN